MESSSIPLWAQGAGTIAIAIVAAIIGVFKYLKTQVKPAESGLAATFIDPKLIKDVIQSVRDHEESFSRETKKSIRSEQELRDSIIENTEAMILQTDATTNLLKFINKRQQTNVE